MWLSDESPLRIAEELSLWEEAISRSFAEGGLWGEEGGLRGGGDGQKCPELPLTELQLHKVNSEHITNFVGTQHIPRKSKSFTLIKFNRFQNLKHQYSTSNFRHIPKTENVGWEFQTWELKHPAPSHSGHLPPPCCLLRPPCPTYQGCECSAWQERKHESKEFLVWVKKAWRIYYVKLENDYYAYTHIHVIESMDCFWDKIGHDYDHVSLFCFYDNRSLCKDIATPGQASQRVKAGYGLMMTIMMTKTSFIRATNWRRLDFPTLDFPWAPTIPNQREDGHYWRWGRKNNKMMMIVHDLIMQRSTVFLRFFDRVVD